MGEFHKKTTISSRWSAIAHHKRLVNKMNITTNFIIEEIKKHLSVLDVADEFGLKLTKAGRLYKTCCPFHIEKTASFIAKPNSDSTKDRFRCYGCGVNGDQINLYASLKGIENGQAISELSKRFGLSGKKLTKEQQIDVSKRHEDKLLEKNFEQACQMLFDYLCSLRNWMKATAKTHADMEQVERDILLISYYQESDKHRQIIDELAEVLLDELNFERQIEIYKMAKGVAGEWQQLLV
jgi:hypothetical protein